MARIGQQGDRLAPLPREARLQPGPDQTHLLQFLFCGRDGRRSACSRPSRSSSSAIGLLHFLEMRDFNPDQIKRICCDSFFAAETDKAIGLLHFLEKRDFNPDQIKRICYVRL
eukprot:Stramenopile-MAST_4_protein_6367